MLEAVPLADLQLLQHLCSICRIIVICLESCNHAFEAIWRTSTALPLILCCSIIRDTCCSLCIPLEGLECWLQGTRAFCHAWPSKVKEVALLDRARREHSSVVHPAIGHLWIRGSAPSLAPAPSTAAASASAPPATLGFDVLPSDCWHVWLVLLSQLCKA